MTKIIIYNRKLPDNMHQLREDFIVRTMDDMEYVLKHEPSECISGYIMPDAYENPDFVGIAERIFWRNHAISSKKGRDFQTLLKNKFGIEIFSGI